MIKEKASKSAIAPIEKTVRVHLPVEEAFKLFTEGIHTWWPLDESHSVGGDDAQSCTFEGWVGGRLYETLKDGTQSIWGTVQAYEPPHRFATTWHPGNPSKLATYLEVRFTAAGEGTTVILTHTGWEARGEEAQKYRDGYNTGWDFVLGEYIKKAT
jgi:uncharacterized protein YndB with AHSA1/START domain